MLQQQANPQGFQLEWIDDNATEITMDEIRESFIFMYNISVEEELIMGFGPPFTALIESKDNDIVIFTNIMSSYETFNILNIWFIIFYFCRRQK